MRHLATLALLMTQAALPAQHRLLQPGDVPARAVAAADLAAALDDGRDLPTTVALAALAGQGLAPGSSAQRRLQDALAGAHRAAAADADAALAQLRLAISDLVETLTFRPRQEADLPAGFPGFAAVDELELRDYPAYRMAQTTMQGGSSRAFWPLFRHIESNGIAMTAPVQMDWQTEGEGSPARPARMAFLYGQPDITPQRTDRGVEVLEVPAATVISIGAIGDDRRDRVESLRARIEAFVAAAGGEWVAAGPLRTMGYNSPMVSRDRRYFEVQLPVRRGTVARTAVVR